MFTVHAVLSNRFCTIETPAFQFVFVVHLLTPHAVTWYRAMQPVSAVVSVPWIILRWATSANHRSRSASFSRVSSCANRQAFAPVDIDPTFLSLQAACSCGRDTSQPVPSQERAG